MKYLFLLFLSFSLYGKEFIPNNANKYKRTFTRLAYHYYGVNAPIASLAAQVHKESTWKVNAKSPYASGLTQFTPQTAKHVSERYPELVANEPLDPLWSMRAMMLYNLELKKQVDAIDECNDWAFTLMMYNGGSGWLWREKRLAEAAGYNRNVYWNQVEKFNAGRRESAFKENRGYPKKILLELQKLYKINGWPSQSICSCMVIGSN